MSVELGNYGYEDDLIPNSNTSIQRDHESSGRLNMEEDEDTESSSLSLLDESDLQAKHSFKIASNNIYCNMLIQVVLLVAILVTMIIGRWFYLNVIYIYIYI